MCADCVQFWKRFWNSLRLVAEQAAGPRESKDHACGSSYAEFVLGVFTYFLLFVEAEPRAPTRTPWTSCSRPSAFARTMTSEPRETSFLRCTWDGEPSTWNDFCRKVRLAFEQTPRRKRHLLAPRIVSDLTGRAWAITGDLSHRELCRRDGVIYLLQYLKESLGRLPVPDIGVRLEALMLRLRRSPAQSMATWAAQLRLQYRHLQVALSRVRTGTSDKTKPGSKPASTPSAASSPVRRASMVTEDEPQAETQAADEDDQVTIADESKEDEVELLEESSARKRRPRKESDSDDSAKALEDVKLWEAHDEELPEVLPSEVLGWLLLRRAGLTSQQRLSVQAAAGNSLRLDAVERALRGMEEELLQSESHGKGGREPPRRRTYWVEDSGHWSLLLGESSELDELVEGGDTLYVGERLPQQVYYEAPASWQAAEAWSDFEMTPSSWWSTADGPEAWEADAWWTEEPDLTDLTPEEQKEVDEAFAVAEQKMRTFVQARQAVKARNLSRGFYPFSPHSKGGSYKGKKGKGKGKSKSSPSGSSAFMTEGFLGAAVGDPSYTGCFICGDKGHDFRSCPKRSSGKGSKGKKGGHVHFVDAMVYTVEEIPEEGECFQNFGDLDAPVSEEEMAGYAVIDSGATETVCSLPALESLVMLKEAQQGGTVGLEVTRDPVKRFKFGNGEHAYASSYVLLDQVLGERKIQLGMFTLDVEGVPVLLGMKTLRRLKAIIDFDRCLVVFAAVNPNLAIGLRRSRTGHLLLNLTQDWLSQGVQLDQIGSELKLHPEILRAEIEENEGVSAFMVVEEPFEHASRDSPARVEEGLGIVPSPDASYGVSSADAQSVMMQDRELSVDKPLPLPERLRSQTPARMSTLKALLTFAALHGACISSGTFDNHGIYPASASFKGNSEDQVQVEEGRHCASFGTRTGRRPGLEGSSNLRTSLFRESHPGPLLQGVTQRKQSVWVEDSLLSVPAAPVVCTTSGPARDLSEICTAGGRCQGDPRGLGPQHHGVPEQPGDKLDGGGELSPSSSRTTSPHEGGQGARGQAEGRGLSCKGKEHHGFLASGNNSAKSKSSCGGAFDPFTYNGSRRGDFIPEQQSELCGGHSRSARGDDPSSGKEGGSTQ